MADAEPQPRGQLLGHADRIAVVDADDLVEKVEIDAPENAPAENEEPEEEPADEADEADSDGEIEDLPAPSNAKPVGWRVIRWNPVFAREA